MNVHEPAISVVIPTYNQADYLATALNSVLAQTYRGYEIVIVDDGSTDETAHIVRNFVMARPRQISYVRQPNCGLAAARNAGIRAAKGHWVALLDSDD
ncbi:MAG: glycosyltransferase family 2 protein, partial [Caldilineaceae bacterium]|nr:glycosyltransferase family 2 protein [Caldilineaceae bacterium]